MDQKELVSGNRDPMLEFSDTMAQWYHCFKTAWTEKRIVAKGGEYPVDSSPYWIVHVMAGCGTIQAAAGRLKKAGVPINELKKYEGKSILLVTDASGLALGFDVLNRGWSSADPAGGAGEAGPGTIRTFYKVVVLLQRCMDAPMDGGTPRRPKTLRVNDHVLHSLLRHSNKILGMKLWPQAPQCWAPLPVEAFSLRWPPTRYCNICKRRSFPSQLQECSKCKAVFHCEDKCFPAHVEHERWCDKLAGYMEHEAQLADLPFDYTAEVTSEDFSLEDFLYNNELEGTYWAHWSLLLRAPLLSIKNPFHRWLGDHLLGYEPLEEEAHVLMFGPDPPNTPSINKPLLSWKEYYEWRGLSLSSLVAPLLSSALSVYHIITSLVPQHFPEVNILEKQSLRIHIIESYREFHTLMTFWELTVLLPHVTFELVFFGQHLSSWCDKKHLLIQKKNGHVMVNNCSRKSNVKEDKRNIQVKVHRSTYNMLEEPEPDLVIGFKPAFLRNDSWFSTLPKLQSLRVPAFFCEISELRCESSQQMMKDSTGGALSPPAINPFHCPLRINGGDNRLPRYSNGFIFHLVYKPLAAVRTPPAAPVGSIVQPDRSPQRSESPCLTFREKKAAAQRCRHKEAKMKRKKMCYFN